MKKNKENPPETGENTSEQNDKNKLENNKKNNNKNKKNRNGHHTIPFDLIRKSIKYKLDDLNCPCGCGQLLRIIGKETTQTLEIVRPKLYAIEHIRYKYVGCIHKNKVITASMPTPPIEKCLAGSSLLADVIIKKYDDHLPLYRQSEIFKREGIDIPRSTLCGWIGQSAQVLKCLITRMQEILITESFKIHTDDTTVPILAPGTGRTTTGRLWVYGGQTKNNCPIIIYDCTPDRRQKWPLKQLKEFTGYIQADAYGAYGKRSSNHLPN